jgi:putative acetyltransferase
MQLRIFRPADAEAIVALFRDTIRRVNCRDYSAEQILVWAPDEIDVERWRRRLLSHFTVVAELAGAIVGFGNLAENGHVDCFYVHADHQGQGIGRALLNALEDEARRRQISRLFSEVSITARPFFERLGFTTLQLQTVEFRNVSFVNFRMEKLLSRCQSCQL